MINPFNVYSLSWRNERVDGNLSMGFEGSWRAGRFGTYAAHLMLDDLQIDKCDTACNEPTSYGFSASLKETAAQRRRKVVCELNTRVSNFAYRTPNIAEQYASFGIGLGRSYSDYDEIRVGADIALVPRTPLKLYGAPGKARVITAISIPRPRTIRRPPGFSVDYLDRQPCRARAGRRW